MSSAISVSSENQVREDTWPDVQKGRNREVLHHEQLNLWYVLKMFSPGESAEKRKGPQAVLKMPESDNVMALVVHVRTGLRGQSMMPR